MRVVLVTNGLPPQDGGGAERYVAELAETLARRGHEILVLSRTSEPVAGASVVAVGGATGVDEAASAGLKARWHLADQWRPSVHRATASALRRFAPDVVHTHNLQRISAAPFTAIAAARLPHVHTAHDFNLLCTRASLTRAGSFCGGRCASCRPQRLIRGHAVRLRLDRLIAPSEYVARRHVDAGIAAADRTLVIRQGAHPGRPRRRDGGGAARVGYIGTLAEFKGVRTLLETRARAEGDWKLVVAGAGPLADEVAEAARRDPRIEARGRVDGDARERFFEEIELLVVPSEWEENAPLVVAEAAVRGIPCLVTDRGGLPELAEVTVVPSGDSARLAQALTDLLVPGRIAARSDALLRRADDFAWTTHVDRVEAVLAGVARLSPRDRG